MRNKVIPFFIFFGLGKLNAADEPSLRLSSFAEFENASNQRVPNYSILEKSPTDSVPTSDQSVEAQKEGDTFLIPKKFTEQQIDHLRDYKDINYHTTNTISYDYDIAESPYNLSNNIDCLIKVSGPACKYVKHFEKKDDKKIYPSYWEDLKIYIDGTTFYVPNAAVDKINTQIYDYHLLYQLQNNAEKDCFDIAFISNGEPFEETNYNLLKTHLQKSNLKNRLYWVQGVDGRTAAYKQAAEQSSQEYFYLT